MSKPIRAITLDLDDTLWPCEPVLARAERVAHEWLAERAPEIAGAWSIEQLRERRMALHESRADLRFDFRTIRGLVLRDVFREAGIDDVQSAPIIEGAVETYMTGRNAVELYPEVRACLERLGSRYRIASLSNGNACLVTIGLDHLFHAMVSAGSHGSGKPHAAIFHHTCRELGCAPEEVVHVGDDVELDIRGARGAGLHAVWMNRAGHAWAGDDVPDTVADLEAFERWLEER